MEIINKTEKALAKLIMLPKEIVNRIIMNVIEKNNDNQLSSNQSSFNENEIYLCN